MRSHLSPSRRTPVPNPATCSPLSPTILNLAHVIANAIDVTCKAYALRNVVSKTPELDDIAASAQRERLLNQGKTCRPQLKGASDVPPIPAPEIRRFCLSSWQPTTSQADLVICRMA